MKPLILFIYAFAVTAAASAVPLCTTAPGIWCEASVGDAGPFTQDSESTLGTGTLNAIIGNIGNGVGGSDVYSILISNPAFFSASLSAYTANGITGETNAALYLYNSLGAGVEAADEGTALSAFNGPAGIYYIGVTPTGNTPEFTVNGVSSPIFTALTGGQVSSPVNGAELIDKSPMPAVALAARERTKSLSAVPNTRTFPNPVRSQCWVER